MKPKTKFIVWGFLVVATLAAGLSGSIMSNVEQAKYTVTQKEGNIEIRDYAPAIVAETSVDGPRDKAIGEGFKLIADYIFGNNTAKTKVAMTAPVTQQANEKIPMTAPVLQQGSGNGPWHVRFVMPSSYTMDSLPKPNNPAVTLKRVEGRRMAAIRFSGMASESNLSRHAASLDDFVKSRHLKTRGMQTYAFYNPPWTLPFLRRNEIMVEIE